MTVLGGGFHKGVPLAGGGSSSHTQAHTLYTHAHPRTRTRPLTRTWRYVHTLTPEAGAERGPRAGCGRQESAGGQQRGHCVPVTQLVRAVKASPRLRPSPALTPAEGYRVTGQAQSRAFPRSGQARPHAGGDRGPLRAGGNAGPLPGRPRRGAAAGPGRRCTQLLRRGPAHLLPGDTSAFSATPRTRR